MSVRDNILLMFYKRLSHFSLIHIIVINIYKHILFPLLRAYLKIRYPNLIEAHYRNSVTSLTNFNAFISDLDITLVIQDQTDSKAIIKTYLKLKSFFIMLDLPEVYFESEYSYLESLKKNHCSPLINLCWHIRKINWSLDTLASDSNELTIIKKERAIKKSFLQILDQKIIKNDYVYNVEDFSIFKNFIPEDSSSKNLCYWSFFLETNKANHIKLMVSTLQYDFINSLMPGEVISPKISGKISDQFIKNKLALEFYELYLAKSTTRLMLAQEKNVSPLIEWTDYLESKLGIAV